MKIPLSFLSGECDNNNNSAKRGEAAEQLLRMHGNCGKRQHSEKYEA